MPQEKHLNQLGGEVRHTGWVGAWEGAGARLLIGFVDLSQAVQHLRVIFIREKCQKVRLKLLR